MRTPLIPPIFTSWGMSDGYTLHGRVWPPGHTRPEFALIYLHGIQSHGGWFEWSASLFAESGSPVLLVDRRGSGLNQEERGDTPSAERWLQDIDELADWARQEWGAKHLALVGVSWGGKLAAAWALSRRGSAAKLLLIAPGIFPAVDVGIGGRLKIAAALLFHKRRTFPIPLNDPKLFTDNPRGQEYIAADSLKLSAATARFFYYSSRMDARLNRAAAGSLDVPTTLVLAEHERIIRNHLTEQWLRRVAPPAKAHVVRFDAAHTLEFARDTADFAALLRDWVNGGP